MNVSKKVQSILVEQLGVEEEEVTPTASLWDDLGADSLDIVEVVMVMEEEFNIEIPDEDWPPAHEPSRVTVAWLTQYVERKLTEKVGRR